MPHITQEQFRLRPNESIEEYNARIAGLRAQDKQDTNINSNTLTSQPKVDFKTPEPDIVFPVETLTPEEKKAQTASEKLQELNKSILGESEFRRQQEEARGLPELQKTQRDLESQLKGLIAEAKAIPIQIQQEFEGRGVTKGGIAPIQRGRLRENAIKALTVSSLLEASKGNITNALSQINRAVAQKFDPIKEQIKVTKANLDLILESPQFSLETKNKALKQKAIQDKKLKKVKKQEADDELILKIAVDAARRGITDALILNQIKDAESPIEAQRIASEAIGALPTPEKPPKFERRTIGGNLYEIKLDSTTGQVIDTKLIKSKTGKEDKIPSFDQFVNEFMETEQGQQLISQLEQQRGQTLSQETRKSLLSEQLKELYSQQIEALTPREEFSSAELKKLEQAGLLNASRQEKLDFLFGENKGGKSSTGRKP